jgi:hypothetical protein
MSNFYRRPGKAGGSPNRIVILIRSHSNSLARIAGFRGLLIDEHSSASEKYRLKQFPMGNSIGGSFFEVNFKWTTALQSEPHPPS